MLDDAEDPAVDDSTTRSGTACFTITGSAFTKLVRARMLDDNPGAAFRLASSLVSDDVTQAVATVALQLCDGDVKLVDVPNSYDKVLKKCAAVRYKKKLTWLYAGRIRIGDKWYRPVAYVSDTGPMDLRNDHSKPTGKYISGGIQNRAWHYCGKDDIVVDSVRFDDKEGMSREVIFEQCGERPHWHDVPNIPQAALEEFFKAGHRLKERSHSKLYGDDNNKWPDGYPGQSYIAREPEPPAGGPNAVGQKRRTEEDEMNDREERRKKKEAEDEARWAAEDAARLAKVAELRVHILAQAGDDLVELMWPAEGDHPAGSAMIPRAPFMVWAFAKVTWLKIKLPQWQTVSPSGMKMACDDPNHTDWCIGGGFDPHDRRLYWDGVFSRAATELRGRLQDEADDRMQAEGEKVTVLVTGPVATGAIYHGKPNKASPVGSVVVLPNLHPRYLKAVMDACAVITENGGETAHLAQVGRERALPIVRMEDACDYYYTDGDVVAVNTEERTVKVLKQMIIEPDEGRDEDDED